MNRDAVARAIQDADDLPTSNFLDLADAAISAMGESGVKDLATSEAKSAISFLDCMIANGDAHNDTSRAIVKNALSALTSPVGWQDIESAPKDGISVLVCQSRNGIVKAAYWSQAYNHWSVSAGPMGYLDEVTHWMPLPAAPTQGEKG